MTEFSGALDNSDFDGNIILLEVEEKQFVYISTQILEILELRTEDRFLDFISLM